MTAFTFRMGAGFAGEVNRTHPASIDAHLNDATYPILGYGLACKFTTAGNDVRTIQSGDSSDTAVQIAGVTVRPFPRQQVTTSLSYGSSPYGSVTPPAGEAIDVLKSGHIMVGVVGSPVLGGAAYVWAAAASGAHVQGGFEAAADSGSTLLLDGKSYFASPPDANGICELAYNL